MAVANARMRVLAIAAGLIAAAGCASSPSASPTAPAAATHQHGAAPAPAGPAVLRLSGPAGQSRNLSAAQLAALPRQTVSAEIHGERHSFEGVALDVLLARVGAPQGPALRGPALRHVVVARSRDGYAAAFSLAETDPALRRERVILADRVDGAAIADADGPFRLVVEGDLKPARSARMVEALEVRLLD